MIYSKYGGTEIKYNGEETSSSRRATCWRFFRHQVTVHQVTELPRKPLRCRWFPRTRQSTLPGQDLRT